MKFFLYNYISCNKVINETNAHIKADNVCNSSRLDFSKFIFPNITAHACNVQTV